MDSRRVEVLPARRLRVPRTEDLAPFTVILHQASVVLAAASEIERARPASSATGPSSARRTPPCVRISSVTSRSFELTFVTTHWKKLPVSPRIVEEAIVPARAGAPRQNSKARDATLVTRGCFLTIRNLRGSSGLAREWSTL